MAKLLNPGITLTIDDDVDTIPPNALHLYRAATKGVSVSDGTNTITNISSIVAQGGTVSGSAGVGTITGFGGNGVSMSDGTHTVTNVGSIIAQGGTVSGSGGVGTITGFGGGGVSLTPFVLSPLDVRNKDGSFISVGQKTAAGGFGFSGQIGPLTTPSYSNRSTGSVGTVTDFTVPQNCTAGHTISLGVDLSYTNSGTNAPAAMTAYASLGKIASSGYLTTYVVAGYVYPTTTVTNMGFSWPTLPVTAGELLVLSVGFIINETAGDTISALLGPMTIS